MHAHPDPRTRHLLTQLAWLVTIHRTHRGATYRQISAATGVHRNTINQLVGGGDRPAGGLSLASFAALAAWAGYEVRLLPVPRPAEGDDGTRDGGRP